ncbi:MAG: nucleotidyltransferase family protein [Acidobacteriia bacterium]|nr:nucleotidyltransferase family protein [Terriglobia bacterium]
MVRNREQILTMLAANRETLRRYGVRRLGLFGSIARGEGTLSSDLDFLVEFDAKTFDVYMDLKDFLEKLFACPVDLVLADALKPRLRENILREAVHAPGL